VRELQSDGYRAVASVEHETKQRLATVRLVGPIGVKVDLLFARSGIEGEIARRATPVDLPGVGRVPVAPANRAL
jgi:hypothetical protein